MGGREVPTTDPRTLSVRDDLRLSAKRIGVPDSDPSKVYDSHVLLIRVDLIIGHPPQVYGVHSHINGFTVEFILIQVVYVFNGEIGVIFFQGYLESNSVSLTRLTLQLHRIAYKSVIL